MSSCAPCLCTLTLPTCFTTLVVGTVGALNTDYKIYIKNLTTGKTVQYSATSSGAGLVSITVSASTPFSESHSYVLWATLAAATPDEREDITVSGTSTAQSCFELKFETIKDSAGVLATFTSVTLKKDSCCEENLNPDCECVTQAMIDGWLESVVAGNGITVDNTDPQNPIINALTTPLDDGLLTGGQVTWIANYDYEVAAATYAIGGVVYSSPLTNITLDPADPVLDRLDTFVVDTSGVASALTGTPSGSPVEPDVDYTTQLRIAFALIDNNTTAPTLTTQSIYLENTEWVTADNTANITLNSANNPYAGAVDIEGTNVANGNYITFTPTSFPSLIGLDSFVFKIRSKAAWGAASRLVFRFQNGTTNIGNAINFGNLSYGFVSATTGSYQNINIPLTDFGNIGAATHLRITKTGSGTIGFYLDNIEMVGNNNVIVLQSGSVPYKSYVAVMSQVGVADPVVTVLQNEIGNIVWTRSGVGAYFGTLTGAFVLDKTWTTISGSRTSISQVHVIYRNDVNSVFIATAQLVIANPVVAGGNVEANGSDDVMETTTVEIRVYP